MKLQNKLKVNRILQGWNKTGASSLIHMMNIYGSMPMITDEMWVKRSDLIKSASIKDLFLISTSYKRLCQSVATFL